MKKTIYTTIQDGETIEVLEDGKAFTKGFTDMGSAMHSVWVANGKKAHEFYSNIENEVFLEIRDVV